MKIMAERLYFRLKDVIKPSIGNYCRTFVLSLIEIIFEMTLPTITILILGLLIIVSKISGFSQYVKNNKYLQVIILSVLLCFIVYNGLNMKTFDFQEITGISVLIISFVLGSFTFFKKYIKNRNG